MSKSLHRGDIRKTVLLGCIMNVSKIHCMFSLTMTAQLEYINHLICCNFSKVFPIILALYLMLSVTYYAGIIGP